MNSVIKNKVIMNSNTIYHDPAIESIYFIPQNNDVCYINVSAVVDDQYVLLIYSYAYDASKESNVEIKEIASRFFPNRFLLDSFNERLTNDEDFLMSVMAN